MNIINKIKDELRNLIDDNPTICKYTRGNQMIWDKSIRTLTINCEQYPENRNIKCICKDLNNLDYKEVYLPGDIIKYILTLYSTIDEYDNRSWDITYFYNKSGRYVLERKGYEPKVIIEPYHTYENKIYLYGTNEYMFIQMLNDINYNTKWLYVGVVINITIKISYKDEIFTVIDKNCPNLKYIQGQYIKTLPDIS